MSIHTIRKNSIMRILMWVVFSIATSYVYSYTSTYGNWNATSLARIYNTITVIHICIITLIVSTIIGHIFAEMERASVLERTALYRFMPILRVIIFSIIWIIGVTYALETLDINTTSILTGAGIGGAILALASKDILTNLFGSLSILLSQTFEIGETIRVRINSNTRYEGVVEEIALNYTKLTSITGELVYMPNRLIYTETVENLSRRRFFEYVYKIPFQKGLPHEDVETRLRIIEGKIESYDPIDVTYETDVPNANDFVYKITVLLPEENLVFDREIRYFLMAYIFGSSKSK